MGVFDFTAANFQTCMNGILQTIVGHFTAPFYFITKAVAKVFVAMQYAVEVIRSTIRRLKDIMMKMFGTFIETARASFIPVQKIRLIQQKLLSLEWEILP